MPLCFFLSFFNSTVFFLRDGEEVFRRPRVFSEEKIKKVVLVVERKKEKKKKRRRRGGVLVFFLSERVSVFSFSFFS